MGNSKKSGKRKPDTGKRERIDSHAVTWICNSNIDDAKQHIRDATARTLEGALIALNVLNRPGGDKTRRKLIEARLRKLDDTQTAVEAGGPLSVRCPSCGAAPGVHCKRPSGHRVFGGREHDARCNKAEEGAK